MTIDRDALAKLIDPFVERAMGDYGSGEDTTDEIADAVIAYLSTLDGTTRSAVRLMTRLTDAELDELGGLSAVPVEGDREALIESLRVAMLGDTDGGFIGSENDIPAGEMFRLAAEWVEANAAGFSRSPLPVGGTEHTPRSNTLNGMRAALAAVQARNTARHTKEGTP